MLPKVVHHAVLQFKREIGDFVKLSKQEKEKKEKERTKNKESKRKAEQNSQPQGLQQQARVHESQTSSTDL